MNVRGRDLGSFVDEARARVAEQVPLPQGVTIQWGGEFESKERAMARLLLVVPLALLITLVLLFNAFGAFAPAVIVLLNVPFALVGGVAGLAWMGMPLSVSAAVGFIALIGQASLNGVLVLSAILERQRDGAAAGCRHHRRLPRTVARGAHDGGARRPRSGAGRDEPRHRQRSAASHRRGDRRRHLSACALTLVVLPAMYRLWARAWARLSAAEALAPLRAWRRAAAR